MNFNLDNANGGHEPPETIEGVIDHIVFRNEENGYTVAQIRPLDGSDAVTVVGTFINISPGLPLTLKGGWLMHPRFGRQFEVKSYKADIPRSAVGVRKYLAGFIRGVGPVMAKRIVDHFGEDTIDIIEKDPRRLTEVEGLGRNKAVAIAESWLEQQHVKDVMMFLQSHNISIGYAMKIYQQYGDAAVEVLKHDPYVLSSDIFGIGFKIADRIALNLGIDKDSQVRLRAGLRYVLEQAGSDGHVFLPTEVLMDEAVRILEADRANVEAALQAVLNTNTYLVEDENRIYLAPFHYSEKSVADKLARLVAARDKGARIPVNAATLKAVSRDLGFTLSEEQESVLHMLAGEKVAVLTGGPGTGKTATTRAVIRLFQQAHLRVLLAAPTGRAAKRLAETTGEEARTIHRLLEYKPGNSKFDRNEDNPLEADLLIIDEMSMVDNILMHHLLKAVKLTTTLLLVGDADQLPSVGAGNILRDLIAAERIATVRLSRIFRQEAGSTIIDNAHRINAGEMPHLTAKPGDGANFFFFNAKEPESIRDTLVDLCTRRIPEKFHYDPMTQVQVLTPMYRGLVGVDHLNEVLQNKLNPGKDVPCGNRSFRIGDRVMQIKNNYDKEVYNGDVGLVLRIEPQESILFIQFPDQSVKYEFKELDQLVLAYAITVHKSQGSEYPVVVLPLTTHHFPMLQRNMVYTAVTRARDLVVVVGAHKAVAIAVKNNKIEERYTALGERLKKALDDHGLFNQ